MTRDGPGITESQQLVCPDCGAQEFGGGIAPGEPGEGPRCEEFGHEWPPVGDDGLPADDVEGASGSVGGPL